MSAKQLRARPTRSPATTSFFIRCLKQNKQILSDEGNTSFSILLPGPVLRHNHRDRNGDGKDEHDDGEGQQSRDRKIMRHNHFDSDKREHEREAGFQINETIYQVCEQEIERAQPENGADVRRINNKRVLSDRENGRDRIDRENQIHYVDDDQDQRERRQHPAVVDFGGEVLSVEFIGHVNGAPDEAHHQAVLKFLLSVLSRKHAHGSDKQKDAENVENKMKMR